MASDQCLCSIPPDVLQLVMTSVGWDDDVGGMEVALASGDSGGRSPVYC